MNTGTNDNDLELILLAEKIMLEPCVYNIIQKSSNLLNLNCGSGQVTAMLSDKFCNLTDIVGLDCAEETLISAENNYCKTRPNLSYELGTYTNFKFAEKFDTIFYLGNFCSDYNVFTNCYNNLVDDGFLLFSGYITKKTNFHNLFDSIGFSKWSIKTETNNDIPLTKICLIAKK